MNSTEAHTRPVAPLDLKRLGWATLAALIVNLIVYAAGSATGATWIANGQTVGWYLVVIATALSMAVGGAITFLLARRWSRATVVMAWVGLAFALVSVPSPILASDAASTGWSLAAMHAVTGVVWFVAVHPRSTRSTA
jgi:hypothetical protein